MHTDNQSIISTIKKRTREDHELSEDILPVEKHPKLDHNSSSLSCENEEKNNHQIIEKELLEINSTLYRSFHRNLYLDFMWKYEIPRKKFDNDLHLRETISTREGTEYFLSLSNVLYNGTMSSSLIFGFQNGKGLSFDDFEQDLKTIDSTMLNDFNQQIEKETFAKPANITKINIKLNNKNLNISNSSEKNEKIHEDIEIDITNHLEINNSNDKNEKCVNDLNEGENIDNSQVPQSQTQSDNKNDSNGDSVNTLIDDSIVYSDSVQSNGSLSESSAASNKSKNSSNGVCSNNYYNSNCSSQATQVHENVYTSKISDGVNEELLKNLKGTYYNQNKRKNSAEECSVNLNGRNLYSNNRSDDNITYDIFITFTLVNFKTITYNFKEVKSGEILIKEIPLSTFFYTSILPKEDPEIVIEMSIKKNHNFNTGFTGIVNQAMTCYMNSMLQTLNVLGYFKKALYQVPVENSDLNTNSVLHSLQRLFYDLLTEDEPVSTSRLTKSFGWSDDEIFIQHDVQEFNLLLCDILENRMKGTKAEGTFKYLFEGKIQNCIECLDVNYHSKKEESFYDLQLTVKGCKSIYESFNKYTEDEIMDGEDKYFTDEYGKQKAKKFLKFLNFPPVLILQLKRFEYNPRKDQMDKINDNFQFYEEIDLSQYKAHNLCGENITMENCEEEKYSLHSIVVHKGNINNGHYFAYIRPYTNDRWYLFNDEIVREADYDEVFTCNYGGLQEIYKHKDRGVISKINTKQDGNAYILVYIKNSMKETILQKLTCEDIPIETREVIEKEKALEKKMREEIIRKTRNIDIFLLSKQDILNYNGLGITPSALEIEKDDNILSLHSTFLNLPKDLKIKEFRRFVSQSTGIPEQFLLIFTFCLIDPNKISKRNKFKMNHLNEDIIENKTMYDLKQIFYDNKLFLKNVYIYIDFKFSNKYGDYKILTENSCLEEGETEHILSNEAKSVIYINNKNKMKFCFNDEFMEKYNMNLQQEDIRFQINKIDFINDDLPEDHQDTYKLIFFKVSQLVEPSFKIDDIIPILFDANIDEKLEIYKDKYKAFLQKQIASTFDEEVINQMDEVDFLLEKTSGCYDKKHKILNLAEGETNENNCNNNESINCLYERETINELENNEEILEESELLVNIHKFSDVCLQNNDSDAFILVPYLRRRNDSNNNSPFSTEQISDTNNNNGIQLKSTFQLINRIWDNTFNFLYVAAILKKDNNIECLIKNQKLPFILSESLICIQKRLFSYISENNNSLIKELLRENLEIFLFDEKKVLYKQDDYIETLTYENLFVFTFKVNLSLLQEINKYPLLKFIGVTRNVSSHKIDFRINILRPELEPAFELQQFILYDIDNNPFAKLNFIIPSQLREWEDIINYIYQGVLVTFPQYANISQKNFFFLIQNGKGSFAYDLFNKPMNLFQFKHMNISIVYRLQPYLEEEIELMNGEGFSKLFCAFATKEGKVACDPLVFYTKTIATVKSIKMFLLKKMNRIDRLTQCYGEITLQKVKFYTYSLIDYNPVKDILLLNNKDDEGIFNYFKRNGAYNLLVEFLVVDVNANKTESSNTNGFLNDSLSLKQNFLN